MTFIAKLLKGTTLLQTALTPLSTAFKPSQRSIMVKAVWNGATLAESDSCQVVDGNQYFPADSVKSELFKPSSTTSFCGYKGIASYMSAEVDGKINKDCAWVYREPKTGAANIANYVAFWKGVQVTK